ncbi:hypothetical protein [Desulfogranum mediterraneum]|uniref:hypothetical protein n=1 Tax=Desulfogranum mediterraneum TaxID=160661 RepID=UPI00040932DD|nr:hypothetical protein [Desulfogranum mediterraneum]
MVWLIGLGGWVALLRLAPFRSRWLELGRRWLAADLTPSLPAPPPGDFFRRNALLLLSATLLLVAAVWLRSWENLSVPALYVEDAGKHFSRFFQENGNPAKIFLQPNGYPALITYSLAYLVGKTAVTLQPWLYLAVAMVTVVATLMALPLSGLLYPPPRHSSGYLLRMGLITLCTWAGPYSVLAIPLSLLLWLLGYYRANRIIYLWTIINGLLYYSAVQAQATALKEALLDPQRYLELFQGLFGQVFLLDSLPLTSATVGCCWSSA